ncbi:MAG: polysaccharide deacetylase family protein [Lachnospiraceae bacterium]|nr:polysaccharide deacetylase family protein [Lachnospiraceae bacterium]
MVKKWIFGIVIIVGIAAVLYHLGNTKETSASAGDFSGISPYDNTQMKEEAAQKLKDGIDPVKMVSDDVTTDKYIGLSFQGLSDSDTNQKMIALLKKYDRRATFFVPGVEAVECKEDVLDMVENGNTIGSNSLNGSTHMENMSETELINDLTAANKVITSITGEKSPMLQCRATEYTEDVLKTANACGNEKVVYTPHNINYQSFTSYEQTYNYINKLNRGSILTIRVSGVLDEIEVENQEVDERPAEDMQPAIDEEQQAFMELPEEERITKIVEWVLMALDETNYQTKSLEKFQKVYNGDTTTAFDDEQELRTGEDVIVFPYIPMETNYAGLQIRGIETEERLNTFLQKLQDSGQQATFYVTTEEIEKYPHRIQKILDLGYSVENGGNSKELLTDQSVEAVQQSIRSCNKMLKEKYQIDAKFFMPAGGRYDDAVKEAVQKENMTMVTYSKRPVMREGVTLEELLQTFRRTLAKGSLVYIDLDTFEDGEKVAEGVVDMIADKDYTTLSMEDLFAKKGDVGELTAFTIPSSLSAEEIAALKEKGKTEASARQIIYTTERAVAFSFSGIENGSAVENVLQKMAAMEAKGTFFVTYQEMKTYSGRVKEILSQGHEIGIEIIPTDKTSFASACNEIAAAKNYLEWNYNVTTDMVMSPISRTKNEKAISEMKKAIRAMDCTLAGSSVSVTQSALKGITTAPEYYSSLTQSKFSIQMGQIIYTRLDYLDNSDILGDVLLMLKQDKIDPIAYYDPVLGSYEWIYEIKSVGDVVHNTADGGAKLYSLNSGEGAVNTVNVARNDFSDPVQFMDMVKNRYIGNPDVTDYKSLVNFTGAEIDTIDKTGLMPGNKGDNHVFLSFDDWGTDKSLNHLLYVLHKYQIKATFFVRSNRVSSNPNLLREIAMEGHEIASHTSTHLRLSNEEETGENGIYSNSSLSAEEALALRYDLAASYEEMYRIVGDLSVDGHPSLVPIFRPPTLAVSRIGLLEVFETGYQYSISGDFSTQDYTYQKADGGVDKLTNVLMNGYGYWGGTRKIQSHSIVVMHMSENSECTAEAIENWMEKGARSHFDFTVPIYQYLTQ